MKPTQEKALRNFWYPVVSISKLKESPQPFTLLGEKIVLWLNLEQKPCAILDRCYHRSAQLSKGWVEEGAITCPYHAWKFNKDGECVGLPQLECENKKIPHTYKVQSFLCEERYGYAWVCLGTPVIDIPKFEEALDPSYRFFHCFDEVWNTSSMRVVENELDMAHFSVVHRGTFGNKEAVLPLHAELTDLGDYSLHLRAELKVKAPEQQAKNTGSKDFNTTREMNLTWRAPSTIKLKISYPSGLHHVIINHSVPIDDKSIQFIIFCFRNDTNKQVSESEVIAFERLIHNEDKAVLESTNPDVPLTTSQEAHIPTDKPGLLMRKKMRAILNFDNANLESSQNLSEKDLSLQQEPQI